MADVIVKLRVMPSAVEVNLNKLIEDCKKKIEAFGIKKLHSAEQKEVAFGLKAVEFIFLIDEKNSNIDSLENEIKKILEVSSVEVLDVRRAIG